MIEVQIINLPNILAKRIGPRASVFTADLLRRAEAALAQVSKMFGFWLRLCENPVALNRGGGLPDPEWTELEF